VRHASYGEKALVASFLIAVIIGAIVGWVKSEEDKIMGSVMGVVVALLASTVICAASAAIVFILS